MPETFNFLEVERQRDRNVFLLFLLSFAGYALGGLILWFISRFCFFYSSDIPVSRIPPITPKEVFIVIGVSFLLLLISWVFELNDILGSTLSRLCVEPPDENDKYHRVFLDIIEELKLASGIHNISAFICMDRAINAFTISDLKGNIVIGVTEGAVSRLSRQQLEAVIAHEIGHVIAGDSLSASIFVAMFQLYGATQIIISKLCEASIYINSAPVGFEKRDSKGGGFSLYLIVLMVVIFIVKFVNSLIIFALSRQREFRADALAVKVHRNPLALAEALAMIAISPKVSRIGADPSLSALFIAPLSDKTSVLSTHPPLKKRIQALLGFAHYHSTVDDFIEEVKKKVKLKEENRTQRLPFVTKKEEKEFFVMKGGKWEGPFGLTDLMGVGLAWDTFVRKGESSAPKTAIEYDEIKDFVFAGGKAKANKPSVSAAKELLCPTCSVALDEAYYEGAKVYICPQCYGILSGQKSLDKIIFRHEQGFSDEIKEEGERLIKMSMKITSFSPVRRALVCPKCRILRPKMAEKVKMHRKLFSIYAPIEVDVCTRCELYWFDAGELEILQYIMERLENSQ